MFTRITNELSYAQSEAGAIVWFDYDNDGWPDVLCGGGWGGGYGNRLFHNNRDGTFAQVSEVQFAGQENHAGWSTVADSNDDGYLDIIAGNTLSEPSFVDGNALLYLNRGDGGFTKIPLAGAAVAGGVDARANTVAATDLNRDGLVDLALGRGGAPQLSYLLKNTGAGVFAAITNTPWTLQAAVHEAIAAVDYDGDGAPDLLGMATAGPRLFRNNGSGDLERVTNSLLGTFQSVQGMSPACGDFDNDGDLDVVVSYVNSAVKDVQLFLNDGTGGFTLGFSHTSISSYVSCADYDNDGRLDLFVTGWNSRCRLYRNLGGGSFTEVLNEPIVQDVFGRWPMAGWGDYDNNGFLDLLLAATDSSNMLYRNSTNGNHWLKFKLKGQVSNRAAIGAVVRVKATIGGQEVWQMRVVQAQSSFTEILPHFGLGDATSVDLVRIEWPSGNVQELVNVTPDVMLTVTEPVRINPVRPTASLGGSVSLTNVTAGLSYQWRWDGVELVGQTNRILNLTNITAEQEGRYSVVVSNGNTLVTNFVYLIVDTQFTKITAEPWNSDRGGSFGSSVGDYNGDGYLDMFIGRYRVGRSALYQNNGEGTFRSITNSTFPLPVGDCAFGPCSDFDNDGRIDSFVWSGTSIPSYFLYNSGDGAFAKVPLATMNPWSMNAIDYDHDGLLDLYLTSGGSGFANRLYRNLGGRTFQAMSSTEVGAILGVTTFGGAGWVDYDDDGWEDVAVSDMNASRCRLYRNTGGGRFEAVNNQVTQAIIKALLVNWGDYDNDGRVDLGVAAFGGQSGIFRNLGGGNFERASIGLTIQGNYNGVAWGDYDNDGFLDLFMTYGNNTGNSLFRNNGNGTFTSVSIGSIVTDRLTPDASYAGLWFDYDNDGFLDLFVPNGNDAGTASVPNYLYHNNGNANAWLKVKLVGTTSNRDGAGAKVRVQATFAGAARWQRRDVTSGGDTTGGAGPIAHFGLGDATSVTTLRIEWPSGTVQVLSNMPKNQILTITEPRQPLLALEATAAGFTGTLKADNNQTYQVHVSDDLAAGWSFLTNVTSDATGTANWSDPSPAPQGRRFYKALKPPTP